ncbi:MAG TPA: efflux RND transporter periplasmic adaptor subunit [Anaeromyxobacteraceae bacterium]|jgi:cobalt-zinc-cadmium efflux system membrane fusion protein|nr:efflux RND transporter periplasmic adaptor subunit [Anaeromyxobacteraceae bacterium]
MMTAHCRLAAALLPIALASSGCSKPAHAQVPEDQGQPVEERAGQLFVPERSPLRARLAVAAISTQPVRHALEVPASAEADPARITRIPAPLPGRVVKLLARLGETVREGSPLFTLDSPDLAAAQSDYLKARSAEALTARALKRQRDLTAHGIGAQKDLEQAESDADQARSELARAATRLQLLGATPGEGGRTLTVRSPIAGRVIELATAAGQYQSDPAAVLMVVADLSTIWVTAQVPEKDLQRVAAGDEATVQFNAYPGERFAGRVLMVGDVLAPETRTVKVRIALANAAHRLKPGMFATVGLMGKERPELLVPPSALVVRGDRSFVLVEKAAATFERRPVELGEPLAAGVPVTRGLSPGERIVTADAILFP